MSIAACGHRMAAHFRPVILAASILPARLAAAMAAPRIGQRHASESPAFEVQPSTPGNLCGGERARPAGGRYG